MREDLPSGTVTFLFTDVEGSTKLLQELGTDAYAAALAEHRWLIREACAAESGIEVDTQGDAFFFAFSSAPGAVAAAEAMTEALSDGPIQVRIGLHTGTPLLADEGYVGGDVHRAARIAAVGHGGQVLVSAGTAQLVGLELTDLGEHRLKDLSAPERIYQLGNAEFPALKSLYRTNLPIPSTPFLGREAELAEVASLLASSDTRMLTLTGPGGTGKTRLAAQAAGLVSDSYLDGVWWIPLAPLRDPELVLATAAQIVGSKNGLAEHIRDKEMLLLFDNFEQVVEAATHVAELLASCPNLDLLVTSREPLHVTGEQEYPVPPFLHEEGVGFFLARARAVKPDFEADAAVSEICRRLDDLPLALELAAARVKALTSTRILERLEHRLPLLTGGARDLPERQRTLQATIDWSYDLLGEEEQRLFARLSVFSGGCTLEAAEDVCDADLDTLRSLVDKSLVRFTNGRYWMLETIREYALDRLDGRCESDQISHRHAEWLLALGLPFEQDLGTPRLLSALPQLRAEIDNSRVAVAWALEHTEPEFVLRLILASWAFVPSFGEVAYWYDAALPKVIVSPSPTLAHAFRDAGAVAQARAESTKAEALLLRSLSMHQELGDEDGQTRALRRLGENALAMRDVRRGRAFLEESLGLATRRGDSRGVYLAQAGLGRAEHMLGDSRRAVQMLERSLALARAEGHLFAVGEILHHLGDIALDQRGPGHARKCYAEAASIASRIGHDHLLAYCLAGLAASAALEKKVEHAGRLWGVLGALEESGGGWVAAGDLVRYEKLVAAGAAEAQAAFERGTAAAQDITAEGALRQAIADELSSEREEEHDNIGSDPYASH